MGEVDISVLHPIYRKCVELNKENNWNFSFKEDTGSFETMIEFKYLVPPLVSNGNSKVIPIHPPLAKNWDDMKICNAPDILDFNNRIIIEYEEESKPQKGPKIIKKGHWVESKRDELRDDRYKMAGFRVCKIWEVEIKNGVWEIKLFYFLADCYTRRNLDMYQNRFISEDELFEQRQKLLN